MAPRLSAVVRLSVAVLIATTITSAYIQDDEDLIFDDVEGTRSRWEVEAPLAALSRPRRQFLRTSYDEVNDLDSDGSGSGFEPHTYRIKMHILVPWGSPLNNRNSDRFERLSRRVRASLERAMRSIGGEKTPRVARFRRSASGQVVAWLDLMVEDYADHRAELETTVRQFLAAGKLGDLNVDQQYYEFSEPRDGSGGDGDGDGGRVTGGCAGDSKYTCSSGQVICDVQVCDGSADCLDGDDEDGCGCHSGQFFCDTVRCLDGSVKCDGIPDCVDLTDEVNCGGCPPGQQLCDDGATCIYPGQSCENTCSGSDCTGGACTSNQWTCSDGACIPKDQRCDSRYDCADYTDEYACDDICLDRQFECDNGMCIDLYRRCDLIDDCVNAEDEAHCPCEQPNFQCENLMCIPPHQRCDGRSDCDDETDEVGCLECPKGFFRCFEEGVCINMTMRCDGLVQCQDGSDERDCPCQDWQWACRDRSCIAAAGRCDGTIDCADKSDEQGCTINPQEPLCWDGEFTCRDGSCVSAEKRCDRAYDCPGGDDEEGCESPPCSGVEWTCAEGSCIPQEARCDGRSDCPDDSDEADCTLPGCNSDEWTCRDGACLPLQGRCDGFPQCWDASDEDQCPLRCGPDDFTCRDGTCVPKYLQCDRTPHCPDGSDEVDCPQQACTSNQWTCSDGSCIPKDQRCDSRYDCPDYTDEYACDGCRSNEWTCLDRACIPIQAHCDGRPDCLDRSDETNCPGGGSGGGAGGCQAGEWRCESDGACIPESSRCNDRQDCFDGSDEARCSPACKPDEFPCADDGTCIPQYMVCDGRPYCRDESDERDCPSSACRWGEFRCHDGTCISASLVCDGQRYCWDGSDEWDCPTCSPDQFRCGDDTCLEPFQKCNGLKECANGEDEENCRPPPFECRSGDMIDGQYRCNGQNECPLDGSDEEGCPCRSGEHQCERDGKCIRKSQVCDSRPDCSDASDELNCPQAPACGQDEWQCTGGQCIPSAYRCDGQQDCSDNSDETVQCTTGCGPDDFTCRDGTCVPKYLQCDRTPHCPDNSDEVDCPQQPQGCGPDDFTCRDGTCVPKYLQCDRTPHCPDNSDEVDCPQQGCGPDEFTCRDGFCVPKYLHCDRTPHCPDGSDELDCDEPVTPTPRPAGKCTEKQFQCQNGQCIPRVYICDAIPDCEDGSDEDERNCRCQTTEFRCGDGRCIPDYFRCDDKNDCTDGSDERQNCDACSEGEYQCPDRLCIRQESVCNGVRDCSDGSDEASCTTPPPPTTPNPPTPFCRGNEFQCGSGECIPQYLRCNGHAECRDRSDESRCPPITPTPTPRPITPTPPRPRPPPSGGEISLMTYPPEQTIKQSREVIFQCRDEGPTRAAVRWVREGTRQLPPGSTDIRGRLTMPNIQTEHSGTYYCEAQGVPASTSGRRKPAYLQVEQYERPTVVPSVDCTTNQATCMSGDCINKTQVCDGKPDCKDASDEMRCNPNGCEPNEFECDNRKCVLKTWLCDSDNDCGDLSDEKNCEPSPPGSQCRSNEFTCETNTQCIPKSFHCDGDVDCVDTSDEVGCSKPTVVEPPPRNVMVQVTETFTLTCRVMGIPTPIVLWRLNWGHVPSKCEMTSKDGYGVLVCRDAQPRDQGAYSCEAINGKGSVFATPDAIVAVKGIPVTTCQPPKFNSVASNPNDCLTCFCFGTTENCYSSDLYITQLPPPNSDSFSLVGANQDQTRGNYVVRDNEYPLSPRHLSRSRPGSQYSDRVVLNVDRSKLRGPGDLVVYFSLPTSHKGQQLKTFGGYLHYRISYSYFGASQTTEHPDVIMRGNNLTLMHVHDGTFHPDIENQVDVRFFYGQWFKQVSLWGGRMQIEQPATRQEIMMVMENMDMLLIRALYTDGDFINTTLSNVQMDTAEISRNDQGQAVLVEKCLCPQGYGGMSCQDCAPNYTRMREGSWLGRCVSNLVCGPNEYGDPANGIPCLPCPCPLANPNNQFSSSCYLDNDGQVTCNCQQGYEGRRCQYCASGYQGNPAVAGDYCKPASVTCMTSFTCLDGSRHPWSRRCDGIKDCSQYEDERDCDVCFNSGHRCDDRRCIHFERICDGHSDCQDASDERPENCLDELPCDHIHEWTCADPSHRCIDRARHCDGNYDCPDNSDERYCNCTCDSAFNFRCNDATCLDIRLRCNGRVDCADKSDESGCPCDPQTHHSCGDGTCINLSLVCNGYPDCRDRSDEPPGCGCDPATMHRCGDGTCIEKSGVCDGRPDCQDYSDEPPTCQQNCDNILEFTCGTGSCIDNRLVCNGYSDCRDGSDEYYCAVCTETQFQCGDRTCVDRRQLCDGRPDCRDRSDEGERAGCCVAPYFFRCRDGYCIESQRVCDGYWNCGDGSDEQSCSGQCDPAGSEVANPGSGYCQCKEFATGPRCDQCKEDSFYLSEKNSEGCIPCFCMGITSKCSSSNLYRQQEYAYFTNDRQGFEVVEGYLKNFIRDELFVDSDRQELVFQDFARYESKLYYWNLPQRFLGNKVTSYGGNLTYTLRFVPRPGGQSSTNSAFDVEIFGNDIVLRYFRQGQPPLSPARQETVTVQLYEQYWQRQDGQKVNREHLMMALADLEHILIKATYTTSSEEVGLKDVTLDYSENRNTGQERAYAVEMCECLSEYQGSSCEDCAVGYTRSLSGVHLGNCVACDCSGHSTECDPNTGVCFNCKNNTAGNYCDLCDPGYSRYGSSCYRSDTNTGGECACDPRGSVSCDASRCQCKAHVIGAQCDSCKPGYFELSADNRDGCLSCWCSGVTSQCFSSNYYREQLPMQLLSEHGFTFSNRLQTDVIKDGFNINLGNNEISFSNFGSLRDRETYFWSLPQMFTGNRLESYGGNLTVTQRFQTQPGANTYSEADIIIRSTSGREFIWMTTRPLQHNIEQTYTVLLTEDSFTMNQQPASRSEFLKALSSVEAILIRATLSEQISNTFLSDVYMDTALSAQTGQPRATEVEQCRCPSEYSGFSCEMCKPGYYRNAATSRCFQCPCNGHESSCYERPDASIQCECLPGYYGPRCGESGLRLELRPIRVLFSRQSRQMYENFTCSFHSTEPLRMAITREPTWMEDGAPAALMDSQAPHLIEQYAHGAKYFSVLRLLRGHRTVTCRVFDASNKEVAQISSQILYTNKDWTRRSPPPPQGGPTIEVTISEPTIKVVAMNSTVQLECSAFALTGGKTRIPVSWSKAGGELPYGRTRDNRQGLLIITEVRSSDTGVYICAAVDTNGRAVTDNVTLTVSRETRRPNVIVEPKQGRVDVNVRDSFVVRCYVEGQQDSQVQWTFGRDSPLPPNVYQRDGALTFRETKTSDTGEYFCTSSNEYGKGMARIYINVVTSPPGQQIISIQVSEENVVAQAGETVRVRCSAGSAPGSLDIQWSRLTGSLPTQSVIERGELQIPNAQPVDSGTYVCRITDQRTAFYNEAMTRITITQYTNLPTVQIQPDRQTINQGTNAELFCRVSGDPPPRVTWTKANEPQSPRVSVENSVLRITNAQESDRGMYVCTATNEGGTAQAAAIIEVERREPPRIEMHPEVKQTVVMGGSAYFQCHLTAGIPTPEVKWTRTDGQPFTSNTEVLSGGVLRFNQLRGDEGGSYMCTAENDVGSVFSVAVMEIQSLPTINIRPGPSPYTVPVGESVRLQCYAEGDPPPSISWQRLQVNFPTAIPSVSPSPNVAVYEISSVSKADEGTYVCSAQNSAGVSEERMQLYVQDKLPGTRPTTTGGDGAVVYVPAGSSYEFICSESGPETENLEFSFQRSDSRPLPSGARTDKGTLYLSNVDETASGEYACVGRDRIAGLVRFTIYTIIQVIAPPRISLDPARQVVRPGDMVRIRCSATGPQPITINWSKESGRMPASVIINGGELTFRGIATTDAGRYICVARNNGGTTRAVAEVVVNEEPLLTARDPEVTVYVGQTAELRCETSGINPNNVRWNRVNGRLPPSSVTRGNILRLPLIEIQDSGDYQCEVTTQTGQRLYDIVTLTVRRAQTTNIQIRSIPPNVHRGDNVELVCEVENEPAAAITWQRMDGEMPYGAQPYNNRLRIPGVRSGGIYVCSATTRQGIFDERFGLVIRDIISESEDHFKDVMQHLRSENTRSVALGLSVTMECHLSLPGTVSYTWSKKEEKLPLNAHTKNSVLDISEVQAEDAGVYVCTSRNQERSVDLPTLLIITGVVPRFNENSYLALQTLPRAYLMFDIEISFKPESADGLILYNSQRAGPDEGDFVAFGLVSGFPEFRFNIGAGPAIIRGTQRLEMNQWHTVKLSRNRKEGRMVVNGGTPVVGVSEGRFLGLDLVKPLYLGGVPDFQNVHRQTGMTSGFRGCISRLVTGNTLNTGFVLNAMESVGISSCETCVSNPCNNNGVCQEAYNERGHKCFCPAGFLGELCENAGESCYDGACGTGRCINKPGGFECYCPFGKIGDRCNQDISIYEPAFGDEAYIAFPTPWARRRFAVDMNFKPESVDDGVLMYCAQMESGSGDFTSLAIRNKRLEFRFNSGSGTANIQSEPIAEGEWIKVRVNRTDKLGSLMVNDGPMVNGESPGKNLGLNLVTHLFIGGIDNSRIQVASDVGVKSGFKGCVSEIRVMDQERPLKDALVDSANVDQCGGGVSPCSRSPCQNSAACVEDPGSLHGYTCHCSEGYSGVNCQHKPGVCNMIQPCQNGGACVGEGHDYTCLCPIGYTGQHCEHVVHKIGASAAFNEHSWVELNRTLLPQEAGIPQVISLELRTRRPNSLLLWYGQDPTVRGQGQDYISIAVKDGFVEFGYELGGGPTLLRSKSRVDDGQFHTLRVERTGQQGILILDREAPQAAQSPGQLHMLNTDGNIYIGGVPDFPLMTSGTHATGFIGCVQKLVIGGHTIDNFINHAMSGVNVIPCPRRKASVSSTFKKGRYSRRGRTVIRRKKTVANRHSRKN